MLDVRLVYRLNRGGGKISSDRGSNSRRETLFCSRPRRPETRPGCCYLSRHCLLKCWHLSLNDGFQFSQNIPKTECGKHPLFPVLFQRRSICFLLALHSCVQMSWLHHRASNHILRIDSGSCSNIKEVGVTHQKKYNYEMVCKESHRYCWLPCCSKQSFLKSCI